MQVVEPPDVGPLMAIAAHPDDIESWCAGTLARSIDAGITMRLLLVTSGEHGSSDPQADAQTVGACRERESLAAAQRLGIAEVWLFASAIADVYVDISAGFERKIAARLSHESQTTDPAALAYGWRERAATVGEPADLPLAEASTVLCLD